MADAATWAFDFDSTLVDFETLEALAELSLEGAVDADARRLAVTRLTDAAMTGGIPFDESLRRRLALLPLTREHVEAVAARAVARLTRSVERRQSFFRDHADRIVIVSGGFREIIAPVAGVLGVAPSRIVANDLTYDAADAVTGLVDGPLLQPRGKAIALRGRPGPLVMIGDGWTDYEVRQAGVADRFYAFTEVVRRVAVVAVADAEVRSVDEMLHLEGLGGR